jgi:hypothetical protein
MIKRYVVRHKFRSTFLTLRRRWRRMASVTPVHGTRSATSADGHFSSVIGPHAISTRVTTLRLLYIPSMPPTSPTSQEGATHPGLPNIRHFVRIQMNILYPHDHKLEYPLGISILYQFALLLNNFFLYYKFILHR